MTGITTSLPRQPAWRLVSRLMAEQLSGVSAQIARGVGLRKPATIAEEDFTLPDSKIVQQAMALVTEIFPRYLVTHCLRSFAFAVALGRRDNIRFDREVLVLASMMHDLALTPAYSGPESFELEGARAARGFLLDHDYARHRADLVHQAIALHASVGVASKGTAEVQLCHFGTGVDVAGIRMYEFQRSDIDRVVARLPRLDFKRQFIGLMEQEARCNPSSNMAGLVPLGFTKLVHKSYFAE